MEETVQFDLQPAVYMADITIENTGNCIIKANTIAAENYYLWISSDLGETKVLSIGPFLEMNNLQMNINAFNMSFKKFNYNEKLISKELKMFLNSNKIYQAQEISKEQLLEECKINIFDYMENSN